MIHARGPVPSSPDVVIRVEEATDSDQKRRDSEREAHSCVTLQFGGIELLDGVGLSQLQTLDESELRSVEQHRNVSGAQSEGRGGVA